MRECNICWRLFSETSTAFAVEDILRQDKSSFSRDPIYLGLSVGRYGKMWQESLGGLKTSQWYIYVKTDDYVMIL